MTVFPLHPLDAMEAIVAATPDQTRRYMRDDFAWEVWEDYRLALAGCVPTGYQDDDMPPLAPEDVVCMCVRDAINACRRWTEGPAA